MSAPGGRAAVVTGGSRGIGRAIVERLARDGADVVFSYAGNKGAAAEVAEATGAFAVQADLTDPGAAERLLETALERQGALDVLVASAAVGFEPAAIADTSLEEFDRVMAGNARSAFAALRFAARTMRDGGRIVLLSTVNTVRPGPGIAPYAASKGAIEQLAAIAALELGERGITVNCVSPGATDTDLLRSTNPPEALEQISRITALRRLGTPSDIADVVALLVSPDGRWITGQNIRATGGLV
ncbi:SDR family oxidoreductase [Actinocorallia longicatena]|uniref:SDR family oxidoreductase n=1 Tax=Actinocorallia longicatena TaxID=111803 RepID=A0ABP6QHS9_9ACTN